MKKIYWQPGESTVLMDLHGNMILDYDCPEHRELIHQKYGGKVFYTSRTGRTGAGYITEVFGLREVQQYVVKYETAWLPIEILDDQLKVCVPKGLTEEWPYLRILQIYPHEVTAELHEKHTLLAKLREPDRRGDERIRQLTTYIRDVMINFVTFGWWRQRKDRDYPVAVALARLASQARTSHQPQMN